MQREEELENAFYSASGEAQAAFGDGGVYMEKYLYPAKHIEMQVLCDHYGNVVCLGERECSIQRKNQKLIEESPSSAIDAKTRNRMVKAAVRAAKAVDYRNAGTIEFLMDRDGSFYFMEMNTRLQVEHTVTEMVTGYDRSSGRFALQQDNAWIFPRRMSARKDTPSNAESMQRTLSRIFDRAVEK